MLIAAAVMGSLIGILGVTLFLLDRQEIKKLTEKLQEINGEDTQTKLTVMSGMKHFNRLVIEINKLIEDKNKARQNYCRMDKELKEAITNISHDFRTPLTSVRGYLQLLEQDSLEDEKKQKYLRTIENRTGSLSQLIENFYELSRVSSGDYKVEMKKIHIDKVFCELISDFYKEFVDKTLEPQIIIEDNLPMAWADEEVVERVFLNIIQNALRYAKHYFKAEIKVTQEGILTAFSNEAGDLSAEDAACLFNRSFTANKERSKGHTGIGLAAAKQLVEKAGGSIAAEVNNGILTITIVWKAIFE